MWLLNKANESCNYIVMMAIVNTSHVIQYLHTAHAQATDMYTLQPMQRVAGIYIFLKFLKSYLNCLHYLMSSFFRVSHIIWPSFVLFSSMCLQVPPYCNSMLISHMSTSGISMASCINAPVHKALSTLKPSISICRHTHANTKLKLMCISEISHRETLRLTLYMMMPHCAKLFLAILTQ